MQPYSVCVFTHDAGLAQAGDGLSIVPSGRRRGGAGAGDALWVWERRRLLWGVEQRGSDLIIRRWAGGVVPAPYEINLTILKHKLASYCMPCLTSGFGQVRCYCNALRLKAPICMPERKNKHTSQWGFFTFVVQLQDGRSDMVQSRSLCDLSSSWGDCGSPRGRWDGTGWRGVYR